MANYIKLYDEQGIPVGFTECTEEVESALGDANVVFYDENGLLLGFRGGNNKGKKQPKIAYLLDGEGPNDIGHFLSFEYQPDDEIWNATLPNDALIDSTCSLIFYDYPSPEEEPYFFELDGMTVDDYAIRDDGHPMFSFAITSVGAAAEIYSSTTTPFNWSIVTA